MKTKWIYFFGILVASSTAQGQCPTDLLSGQNLLKNGDFSGDYADWTYTADPARTNGYLRFDPPNTQNFSSPGFIYVGTDAKTFNDAFATFPDHTPDNNDNKMLMVDGICRTGINLWSQTGIPIKANTAYYFSIWVHALKNNNNPPGTLAFDVNGTQLATGITAPTSVATGWVLFEAIWNSGPNPAATATISIQNTTVTGCDQFVDFAVDDIAFVPGCRYADIGPQPDLGPDLTLCGRNGAPITLDAGVPRNATTTVSWSDGTGGGTGANPAFYTKTVTAPGTYSVCVTDAGSCIMSDVIVISDEFTLSLPPLITLCDPPSVVLDPGFNGPGVTFVWEKSNNGTTGWTQIPDPEGKGATYNVNSVGYYRVTATDPSNSSCGSVTSNVSRVTTRQSATPVDAYYCPTGSGTPATLAISNATGTTYRWYTTNASTTPLATGTSYTTPALTSASTVTYYVEDETEYTTRVGANTLPANGNATGQLSNYFTQFTATQSFIIDSVTVYWAFYNPTDMVNIQFQLTNAPAQNVNKTPIRSGPQFSMTVSAASAAGLMRPAYTTQGVYAVRVPVKIEVPAAGTYRLTAVNANTTGNVQIQQNNMNYPYSESEGVVTITGTQQDNNLVGTNFYGGMYNWAIKYNINCGRIPVRAIPNCALPLDFVSFEVFRTSIGVGLTWTLSGGKGTHFSVQRSTDGFFFEQIGTVNVQNSHTLQPYEFTDRTVNTGKYYYRVVSYDAGENSMVSATRSIQLNTDHGIKIIPNPSKGLFNISGIAEASTLHVYNLQGKEVYTLLITTDDVETSHHTTIDLSNAEPGVYLVRISSISGQNIERIIKE